MQTFFKRRGTFGVPPIETQIKTELFEAETALLEAQTGLEYAQAMVDYNTKRVNRLKEKEKI
jgi:hypothetical protein